MFEIKVGITVFLGTNCEHDLKRVCDFLGWKSEFIWQNEKIQKHYDILFLPGGFAYGDHISAGRIAKLSPVMKSLPVGKTLIVGICNGFQILCESKLLSGALTCNDNLKFISKVVPLNFFDEIIYIPVAHRQGNYIKEKSSTEDVILSYRDDINGSDDLIAGIYDRKNKIIGMMPHPERAVFDETGLNDGRKIFGFLQNEI